MSKPIRWRVVGKPIAKARPRAALAKINEAALKTLVMRNAWAEVWSRLRAAVRVYSDPKMVEAESKFRANSLYYAPPFPYEPRRALRLDLRFVMPRPKKPAPHQGQGMPHTSKPDLDNLTKLVKDALSGVFYCDDASVAELHVWKVYGDEALTEVTVGESLGDDGNEVRELRQRVAELETLLAEATRQLDEAAVIVARDDVDDQAIDRLQQLLVGEAADIEEVDG